MSYREKLLQRWESGTPHHPLSIQIGEALQKIDDELNWFGWKFGGDGDDGEELLLHLDIAIEEGLIKP